MFFGFKKNVKNVRIVSEATNHSAFNYTITGSQYRLVTVTNIKQNVQQWLGMDHTPGAGN